MGVVLVLICLLRPCLHVHSRLMCHSLFLCSDALKHHTLHEALSHAEHRLLAHLEIKIPSPTVMRHLTASIDRVI